VKARYKGLLKNDNQLAMLFDLANLVRVDQMIKQWERSTWNLGMLPEMGLKIAIMIDLWCENSLCKFLRTQRCLIWV